MMKITKTKLQKCITYLGVCMFGAVLFGCVAHASPDIQLTPRDSNGDGNHDMCQISYEDEGSHLSPSSDTLDTVDTDGDGLSDYEELYVYRTLPHVADSDQDQLSDRREVQHNINPLSLDTDEDVITDRGELFIYQTNPRNQDTDGDGIKDRVEVEQDTNPNDPSDPNSPADADTQQVQNEVLPLLALLDTGLESDTPAVQERYNSPREYLLYLSDITEGMTSTIFKVFGTNLSSETMEEQVDMIHKLYRALSNASASELAAKGIHKDLILERILKVAIYKYQ